MQTAPAHTSAAPTTSYTTTHPQNAYPSRASATHHQQHSRSSQSVDRSARGSPPSRRSNPQPTTNGVNPSSTLAPQQAPYESASPTMNVSVQQSPNLANSQSPVSADHSQSRSNVPEGLAIPPRTSSHQRPRNHASGHSRSRGDETSEGRSRRRAQQSSETPSNTNDSRSQRHQKSTDNTGTGSSTEVDALSPVLNHVEITDPAEDIEREHERQLEAQNSPAVGSSSTPVLGASGEEGADENNRGAMKSRHDYSNQSSRRKETTFGKYILGQTLGEGEFGKVKLGWRRDGGVQVAIKLIRRESLGANPSRLPKIYREISILRDLSHPNIVRLHEMVETDRYIGIIMEYASGGELFDFILNNRYLKDHAARRLFAQLISGVGYLHKKGIVHRDLKLENLLLDKNRNIIITDFGFANTFNLGDELSDEIEYNLTNREFVKRMRLDKLDANGLRRGDLMQTSCGSPCYAAPELVVSDSLYTGRKVDVWSCGVILVCYTHE
jgi:protein-serine/threonine kinase